MNEKFHPKTEAAPPKEGGPTWSDILGAVDASYVDVATKKDIKPEEVYSSRSCEWMCEDLYEKLTSLGVTVGLKSYSGWDVIGHEFLVATLDGERWVIDPTWQQFLKKPDASLPHVLRVKMTELKEKLIELGVVERLHEVWLKAHDAPPNWRER